jgi:transcriptional regulator EpsA
MSKTVSAMKNQITPSDPAPARYLEIMAEGVEVRRHVDMLCWTQGDMQQLLPHDILLAAWGNFEEGSVQHDLISPLPAVRSYALGTDSLPFLLSKLHNLWLAGGRKPLLVDFAEYAHLLGSASLPGSACATLRTMRSAVIHGMTDQRGGQDSMYVFLRRNEIPADRAVNSIKVLMPFIDSAIRQVAQLPQQYGNPPHHRPQQLRPNHDDASGLSDRETQIMAWVAMGKTNSEIGTILNISGYTVKNHMQRIFQKLNVFNRTQAVSRVTRVAVNG